jgi:hypothetical protein
MPPPRALGPVEDSMGHEQAGSGMTRVDGAVLVFTGVQGRCSGGNLAHLVAAHAGKEGPGFLQPVRLACGV